VDASKPAFDARLCPLTRTRRDQDGSSQAWKPSAQHRAASDWEICRCKCATVEASVDRAAEKTGAGPRFKPWSPSGPRRLLVGCRCRGAAVLDHTEADASRIWSCTRRFEEDHAVGPYSSRPWRVSRAIAALAGDHGGDPPVLQPLKSRRSSDRRISLLGSAAKSTLERCRGRTRLAPTARWHSRARMKGGASRCNRRPPRSGSGRSVRCSTIKLFCATSFADRIRTTPRSRPAHRPPLRTRR